MSISDKLTYLNTTKQNLKESINNIGGSITDDTTFRNYATELDNIYSNIPKTTGEGSNLSLSTIKGRINYDDILGDTTQDTTTGANLLIPSLTNVDTGTTITKSNYVSSVTISDNEFTFVASGSDMYWGQVSGTGGSYSASNGNKISVGSATKISFRVTNSAFNRAHFTPYDSNNVSLGYTGIQGNTGTYTIPSGTSYVTFRFGKNDAVSGTTYKTKVIVALGDTIPDYQDYTGGQASPNPSYPQDINVVTGTQEVVVQNKNYLRLNDIAETTTDGITYSCENGVISFNGTAERGILIDFETFNLPSGSYYINRNATGTISGSWQNYLRNSSDNIKQGQGTFTTTESQQVFFRVYFNSGVVCTNYVLKPQIELGSTATDFVEHQEQTKTLHLSSNQLFDKDDLTSGYISSTNGQIQTNTNWKQSNYIKVTPSTTYTISNSIELGGNGYFEISKYDNSKTWLSSTQVGTTGNKSYTYTTESTTYYIRLGAYKMGSAYGTSMATENVMLNKGSSALPYETYYNYELSKIGTYQDKFKKATGKNYVDQATELRQGGTIGADNTRVSISVKKQLKANTTYTLISNLSTSFNYAFVLGTKVAPWGANQQLFDSGWQNASTHYSYTTTQDCYINIPIRKTNNATITPSEIENFSFMLYEGAYDSSIEIEPYGTNWYIEKNIGHKKASEITTNNMGLVSQGVSFYNTGVKSDKYLQVYSNVQTWKNNTDTEWNTLNGNYIGILYNVSQIYVNKSASASSEIKTWLEGLNFEMYYVLATPTYTEITNSTLLNELNELEKMYSYNGTTNLNISGNLPMLLSVSALKGE